MKKISKWDIISFVIILMNFGIGLYLAPQLNEQVPTHWNFQGEIDAYSSKAFIIWQMPLIITGIYLLMLVTPFIDPKKRNFVEFSGVYGVMKCIITIFLSIFLWISIAASFGYLIDMKLIIPVLVGLLFIILGTLMPRVKQNYFVGFKTPWAIENEEVWAKTQRVGSISFIIGGILTILAAFLQHYPLFFITFILMVLVPFVYSYTEFRRLKK